VWLCTLSGKKLSTSLKGSFQTVLQSQGEFTHSEFDDGWPDKAFIA
jgi:hypothetical protein